MFYALKKGKNARIANYPKEAIKRVDGLAVERHPDKEAQEARRSIANGRSSRPRGETQTGQLPANQHLGIWNLICRSVVAAAPYELKE